MKRTLIAVVFVLSLMPWATLAAPPVDVTLSKNSDMSFGFLDYDGTHNGNLQLGTNGAITVNGTGMTSDNNTAAGSITVTSASGVVEVRCTDTGKLRNANNTLDLLNAEAAINSGAPFGGGTTCQGNRKNSTPVAVVDLSSTPNPVVLIGAQMDIPAGSLVSGSYSSATGGGQAITVTITFQ